MTEKMCIFTAPESHTKASLKLDFDKPLSIWPIHFINFHIDIIKTIPGTNYKLNIILDTVSNLILTTSCETD